MYGYKELLDICVWWFANNFALLNIQHSCNYAPHLVDYDFMSLSRRNYIEPPRLLKQTICTRCCIFLSIMHFPVQILQWLHCTKQVIILTATEIFNESFISFADTLVIFVEVCMLK